MVVVMVVVIVLVNTQNTATDEEIDLASIHSDDRHGRGKCQNDDNIEPWLHIMPPWTDINH